MTLPELLQLVADHARLAAEVDRLGVMNPSDVLPRSRVTVGERHSAAALELLGVIRALRGLKPEDVLALAPAPAQRWQHNGTGREYALLGHAEVKTASLSGGDKVVVYQGSDGRLWVRGADHFELCFTPLGEKHD